MASFDLVYANNPGQQKVFLKVHFKMNRLAIPKLHNSQVGVESKNFFFKMASGDVDRVPA